MYNCGCPAAGCAEPQPAAGATAKEDFKDRFFALT